MIFLGKFFLGRTIGWAFGELQQLSGRQHVIINQSINRNLPKIQLNHSYMTTDIHFIAFTYVFFLQIHASNLIDSKKYERNSKN